MELPLDVTWFSEIDLMNGLGKLCSVGAPETNTDLIFFRRFMNLPVQETGVTRKVLSTWRPISTGKPSYCKIVPDGLRAALNNLLKDG